jgi:hypothetical protein
MSNTSCKEMELKISSKRSKYISMNQTERNEYIIARLKDVFSDSDYDYSNVVWDGRTNSKVVITCNRHVYTWSSIIANALKGHGCSKCGRERSSRYQRKDFVGESKKKFGENTFNYDKVNYTDAHQDVTLKCIEHDLEFTCIAREHLISKYGGCSMCRSKNTSGVNHSYAISIDDIIQRIYAKWENTYIYDMSSCTHLNSTIHITCPIHNYTWKSSVSNHIHPTNPRGCTKCGREEVAQTLKLTQDECISRFIKLHGELYDYQDVKYVNNWYPVSIICNDHGQFKMSPAMHWKGYGCPSCSMAGVSKGQLEWLKYIENTTNDDIIYKGGKHNKEEMFKFGAKRYKVDGFCKQNKTVYEFLGCWYHGCPVCRDPDEMHCWKRLKMHELFEEFNERKRVFEENGYTMVHIWECEWNTQKLLLNNT